ncbi:GIY-YIG nuclease family protein [Loigolactobacillus bifermentans]|nr:GIY-YIG nuclease family protein [Loigolactobacillus bifermentans]
MMQTPPYLAVKSPVALIPTQAMALAPAKVSKQKPSSTATKAFLRLKLTSMHKNPDLTLQDNTKSVMIALDMKQKGGQSMALFSNDKPLQTEITRLNELLQQASTNADQQADKIVLLETQLFQAQQNQQDTRQTASENRILQQEVNRLKREQQDDAAQVAAENQVLQQEVNRLKREQQDDAAQIAQYQATVADLTKQLRDALVHSEAHEIAEKQTKNPYGLDNELWQILEGTGSDQLHNYIYQLRLADGTYYVGQTHNLRQRIQTHFNEQINDGIKSSAWVRQHGATQLIGLTELVQQEYAGKDIDQVENLATLALMAEYGYQQVRGGVFAQAKTTDVLNALKRPENQQRFGYQFNQHVVTLSSKPTAKASAKPLPRSKPRSPQTKPAVKITSLADAPQTGYRLTDDNITDKSYLLLVGQLNDQRYVAFTRRKKTLENNVAALFTGQFSFLKDHHVHLTRIVNTYHILDDNSADAYATVKAFTMAQAKHYQFLEDAVITDKLADSIRTTLAQRLKQHDTLAQHVKLH